jgi:adenylylsulfate kinase-like enzyme
VLILIGTCGCGKTSIALEVGSILPEFGVPVAVLDLDSLGSAWFPSNNDRRVQQLRMQNLAAVWPNFVSSGVTHLVFSHAARRRQELASIQKAMDGADLAVVRITASPATVSRRLQGRDSGVALETHLKIAPEITNDLDRAHLEDFTVQNENRSLRVVAFDVLRVAGWVPLDHREGS